MLRTTVPCLALVLAVACGESSRRDRSVVADLDSDTALAARVAPGPVTLPHARPLRVPRGLMVDPLAPYYPADASAIVRIDDFTTLQREAIPELLAVAAALPCLGLPTDKPEPALQAALGLPPSVRFDPLQPLAFVRTDEGWVAVAAVRNPEEGGERIRSLDATHCVIGDPAPVASFDPAWEHGFYLPGDLSVIATREAWPRLLAALARHLGIGAAVPALPPDLARLDLALRCSAAGLRVDLRAQPQAGSDTARLLDGLVPAESRCSAYLPPDGTIYLDSVQPLDAWRQLVARPFAPAEAAAEARAADPLLGCLGSDRAAMLDLDPDGSGTLLMLAEVADAVAFDRWVTAESTPAWWAALAGDGAQVTWTPASFERQGVPVAQLSCTLPPENLEKLRAGSPVLATIATLRGGRIELALARCRDLALLAAGSRARAELERLLDHVQGGPPAGNEHIEEADALFTKRVAACSVNLAALYDGCRGAAPTWTGRPEALQKLSLRWRLPAAVAATVDGGILRVAARLPARRVAEAAASVLAAARSCD